MSRAVERLQLILIQLHPILQNQKIKSIKIDWKEMGEFAGDQVFPIMEINVYEDQ